MPDLKLDLIDLRILSEIQRDGRITKLALADRVGLSPTPCWVRLRRLEEGGIVTGYHARLALRQVTPFAMALVEVTLGSHRQVDFDRFERAVRAEPGIVSCWSVGGGVDYVLRVVARDVDAYQRIIDRLLDGDAGIDRYFTYIVTRTVKDDAAMPLEALMEEPGGSVPT
ncbi:winged helix-turn-helix transcriptional regulator [Azospirillum melinis]|uniref:Winged helix-turn-helix transcriptional regulator n=1 Tax=Azospirillum melinis TaxID=328839 RepID=A0ABX2K910_9PROT|nr:Lrp/AsnC family transcriptional regulator [Azospirillum melinis]MBP2307621.1 Lrp/AsnC family transcriptional regulator of ectoine degradation [Azospirillum melinis]NUB00075.1 winged helix-turn-helix transcriptional regulator [Azospirillum melinis]